jgi:hypothetical protein
VFLFLHLLFAETTVFGSHDEVEVVLAGVDRDIIEYVVCGGTFVDGFEAKLKTLC